MVTQMLTRISNAFLKATASDTVPVVVLFGSAFWDYAAIPHGWLSKLWSPFESPKY